jgi:hypothetical protein
MPGQGMDEQLRFAIANKRLLQFTYEAALRVVEPHDFGVQKGRTRLLAFQRRGSGSGRPNERVWRLFDVEQIAGCVVLGEAFPGSRGHQHSSHYAWDVVYARVD